MQALMLKTQKELKSYCKIKGLKCSGNKNALANRLLTSGVSASDVPVSSRTKIRPEKRKDTKHYQETIQPIYIAQEDSRIHEGVATLHFNPKNWNGQPTKDDFEIKKEIFPQGVVETHRPMGLDNTENVPSIDTTVIAEDGEYSFETKMNALTTNPEVIPREEYVTTNMVADMCKMNGIKPGDCRTLNEFLTRCEIQRIQLVACFYKDGGPDKMEFYTVAFTGSSILAILQLPQSSAAFRNIRILELFQASLDFFNQTGKFTYKNRKGEQKCCFHFSCTTATKDFKFESPVIKNVKDLPNVVSNMSYSGMVNAKKDQIKFCEQLAQKDEQLAQKDKELEKLREQVAK